MEYCHEMMGANEQRGEMVSELPQMKTPIMNKRSFELRGGSHILALLAVTHEKGAKRGGRRGADKQPNPLPLIYLPRLSPRHFVIFV